ncbi:ATP-binding protein [Litoreibacter roseus]|uniref:histidine kinase n=1 Tax=Litoreibacter roseus TaxID=2601869 RepID=A0A6N6JDQ8_9RHOB|nr:ATP-binding protein [Litoreibacter roseus]GFE64461.1 sensor histidine kinase [Litoreibacter roseus]
MKDFTHEDELQQERRARLAVERRLELKQAELIDANRKLSNHALSLSTQIIDQRRVVSQLEGQNTKVVHDLEMANSKVMMVERLLWDALETIQDGFALFDADFRLIIANQPYLRALDAGSIGPGNTYAKILDLCIEEGIVDLQGMPEDEWFDFMLGRWQGQAISPITLRLWDGSYIKMADRRTSDGGIVSLALNITDAILREEELRDARDTAQAADRAKSAFLAKMSHELRTPMNGVVGMADLLLEGDLDEEEVLYASTIRNSGDALLGIINDVLDFSKMEADKLELKPEAFNLERIVQDVALIVEPVVHEKSFTFTVDFDQFLPIEYIGDPGRLRQILTNLVGNAIKFTEKGFVLIRVTGMPMEDEGMFKLTFTVEDSGIGIDNEKIDHIFGEFNQIEDEANRKYEGTGLGLAITRGLIEQMDGEIWVESEKGEGTCFGFSLPIQLADTPEIATPPLPDGLKSALVLSDDDTDRAVLSRRLEQAGLNTRQGALCDGDPDNESPPDVTFIVANEDIEQTRSICLRIASTSPVILVGNAKHQSLRLDRIPFLRKPILKTNLFDKLAELPQFKTIDSTEDEPQLPLCRVLAAEDNKTNQLVFKKMIKRLNVDLRLVENGKEAVEAFKKDTPDLVFMDISMPEMDGMEATQLIREYEAAKDISPVPIVAMTAHALSGDEERIKNCGLTHYMTKPLKKHLIEEHINGVAATISPSEPDQPAFGPSPDPANS